MKQNEFVYHVCQWYWGRSIDIVRKDGTAIVCVKFDKKTFPKTGYICDLSVIPTKRKQGSGGKMMQYALDVCREHGMTFARLHANIKNVWLCEWYERLGFKELSRDENELEMIKEL